MSCCIWSIFPPLMLSFCVLHQKRGSFIPQPDCQSCFCSGLSRYPCGTFRRTIFLQVLLLFTEVEMSRQRQSLRLAQFIHLPFQRPADPSGVRTSIARPVCTFWMA